ncbi:SMI1/KNR4 family protein [Thermoactinomyces daqus]|uniref:SMI1/KNR4 family protein n=1 Tax=Thermoactinomyces daqus TaxID=1329516 RepID=UPI001269B15B|nr:SMI1/KNR4 family protein [Thermoactinomyces daqus]
MLPLVPARDLVRIRLLGFIKIERQILHFKQSIQLLKTNLEELNYQFHTHGPHPYEVIMEPDPLLPEKISYLERKIGPIPLVLKCFYKHIGGVNFQGFHPDWEEIYADALWIESIDAAIVEWEECQDIEEQENIFYYPIAPDWLHKENVSGGMFYHIEFPTSAVNPIIIMDQVSMTFLDYLTFSLKWGGFPGLADTPSHNWPLETIKKGLKEP